MVGEVDGEYLRLLLVRQTEHRLDAVELVHVLLLVEQDLAVRVGDDSLLHDGGRDDVVHLLRDDNRLAEIFPDGFVHIFQVFAHARRGKGFPSLLADQHLPHPFQAAQLVDEGFHDDDRNHGEQLGVIFYTVNFKYDEPLVQQVDVLVRVQQEVVATALVILPERGQEVVDVEVLPAHLDVPCSQLLPVIVQHVLVEGVERGDDVPVLLYPADVRRHRTAQLAALRLRDFLVLALPQCQQQRLDAVLLLHAELVVVREEGVEADGLLLRVRVVNPVLALGLAVDQLAQPLVRVARVDQHDVAVLLVILAHEVVHEERLAASARTEDKLVAVRDHPFLHRQVADVQMQRSARHPVRHLDAEGRERVLVVRLFGEEAQGLRDERVEALLEGEVPLVARYRRPKERGHVHRVVPRLALHQGELAAHLVLDAPEFLPLVAPCHHVAVAAHRGQPFRVRLVQVFLDPSLVDLVGAGVAGERVHVPGGLLEAFQVLPVVVDEDVLVVAVVAVQQQAHRGGERQPAVRAVGREPLVTAVRRHLARQVFRVREGVQAEDVVADAHLLRVQLDVLQHRRVVLREREVLLHDARRRFRPGDLVRREAAQRNETAVVHDLLELPDGFEEPRNRLPVLYLLGDKPALAEGGERAFLTAPHLRGLGQEQIAGV